MVTLFYDMIHPEVEVYVDDILAKSKKEEDDEQVLRKLFERWQKFELRLNPIKCSFRLRTEKLLGFVLSSQEVDPNKVKEI